MIPPSACAGITSEDQAVACIEQSLSLHLYENARFLGERLIADFPNARTKHLLATCYWHGGQLFQAVELLRGEAGPECRYLLAHCYMKLPGKLNEAAAALMPHGDPSQVPHGAAGFYLLGRIARLQSRPGEAAEHFSEALALDPLLWQAYEELCQLDCSKADRWLRHGADGATPAASNGSAAQQNGFFTATPHQAGGFPGFQVSAAQQQATPVRLAFGSATRPPTGVQVTPGFGTQHTPPFGGQTQALYGGYQSTPAQPRPPATAASAGLSAMTLQQQPNFEAASPMMATPDNFVTPPPMANGLQPPALPPREAAGQNVQPHSGSGSPLQFGSVGLAPAAAAKPAKRGKPGMGARLDFAASSATWNGSKGRAVSQPVATQAGQISPAVSGAAASYPGNLPEGQEQTAAGSDAGASELLTLLQALGRGLRLLHQFRCQDALAAFQQLPPSQRNTGWVWCQVGRAHFEMVDYPAAATAFERARALEPQRLEGMEVYSTVLWHLKREVPLAHLAQQAVALDRQSPAACCVVGNCFSLQKEHENALRFFQRALQVDPTYVYAYTLAGHEYFATEDFDKGLGCYRHALRLDARHYNAWYGIGQICMRQERWREAEHHFRRAADINRRSSVLHCYTGMALFRQRLHAEALQRLQIAINVDARNPLARFERAAVLEEQGRLQEALSELAALKELAPREGSVYFKMGRIHRHLNQLDAAIAAFTTALDLKPSSADAGLIKSAMEKIRAEDAVDEEL